MSVYSNIPLRHLMKIAVGPAPAPVKPVTTAMAPPMGPPPGAAPAVTPAPAGGMQRDAQGFPVLKEKRLPMPALNIPDDAAPAPSGLSPAQQAPNVTFKFQSPFGR